MFLRGRRESSRCWLGFALEGKDYAAPIGAEKGGDFKIYSDDIFFIEDPRELYKHWPADVWQKIDAHEVQAGMSELQASFAIGLGIPEGSGDYGWRTLHYAEWREAAGDYFSKRQGG